MAGLIEGQQALPHEVVGRSRLVQVEGDEGGGTAQNDVEHESDFDATNSLTETKSVAADALSDNHAFIKVPALRVSSEQEHELRVIAHAAEAFFAAEHQPHVRRFERNLAFAGLEEVAGDGRDLLEFHRLKSGYNIGPAPMVDADGGELTFQGGKNETAYNRAQEEEWQHEMMPFKIPISRKKEDALVTCVQPVKIVLDAAVERKDIFLQILGNWLSFRL